MTEEPLKEKVAVVTGAGRGIGRAIALSLAAGGSKVVVNAQNREGGHADATAQEIREAGGQAIAYYADISEFEQARKLIHAAVDAFGRVDILVNNAGVTGWKMPWEMSEEDWDQVVNVSLKGTFNCTRHACGFMKEQKWGRIINCTSESWISRAAACHYAAAKAGVVGFTRAVAIDLGPYGVTCNAYAPYAKTDISGPRTIALIETKYKLGKISREDYEWGINPPGPEGIGPLIVYLASDRAFSINGKVFYASGGKIALFSEPVKVKTILKKPGIWSAEELAEQIPLFFT
jgi:NAD(P)-dependent dehydrogenase (short-subunit alcohol dehydrogenase family)